MTKNFSLSGDTHPLPLFGTLQNLYTNFCLVIEHLPNDLRDRFTEMREIDLGVENTVDSLEARY